MGKEKRKAPTKPRVNKRARLEGISENVVGKPQYDVNQQLLAALSKFNHHGSIPKSQPAESTKEEVSEEEDDDEDQSDPSILSAIHKVLRFKRMTPIQSETIPLSIRKKTDCLAQAKTGTGKTLAFLIPSIQNIIRSDNDNPSHIRVLILSPTRELSLQIATEARQLVSERNDIFVQTAIGGANMTVERDNLLKRPCQILVATPGRLKDHLNDEKIKSRLQGINTFVLDEADRLLDTGFLPAIKEIHSMLPKRADHPRQSLLFSATVSKEVEEIAKLVLSKGHRRVSTLDPTESLTHEETEQYHITATFNDHNATLLALLKREYESSDGQFKAVVFFNTARGAALAFEMFKNISEAEKVAVPFYELHSRLSQNARTTASEAFRTIDNGILICSDVMARGMDFPNVTHVIMLGQPVSKEQYIHRVGRTGRAGKAGRGIILLDPVEQRWRQSLINLPMLTYPDEEDIKKQAAKLKKLLHAATTAVAVEKRESAYVSWLGYYRNVLNLPVVQIVGLANDYAIQSLCFQSAPPYPRDAIPKAKLQSVVHLLNVVDGPEHPKTQKVQEKKKGDKNNQAKKKGDKTKNKGDKGKKKVDKGKKRAEKKKK
ncbi:hypothetical protein PROFUN_13353 [Planoprotostelium fungivorum]|uniref:ATP-dependent RNA helicase n=1 Tax=Planoprotostelium fungivorum TaxID=1890364 RepID=A0A2P6N423_9EUKA|nr:hypothetical protein PROFUN_13353 [Planoprotostelium fungivorum]